MDSETDFSSDSDYGDFANEIPFVSNIKQLFQFKPVFTAAEIQAKKRPNWYKKRPSWN